MTEPVNRPEPDGTQAWSPPGGAYGGHGPAGEHGSSGAGGLGQRPSDAPEMIAPPAGAAYPPPLVYPPPGADDRPWTPDPPGTPRQRGPLVLFAVIAAVVLGVAAIVGVFLVQDTNTGDPADALGDDAPTAVPAPPFAERLHAAELYDGDWDFRLGDETASAKRLGSWDYDDCTAGALFSGDNDALLRGGCQYRIEGAYLSADGHTRIAEQVLVFTDERAASEAALELDWSAYAFQPDGMNADAEMSGGNVDANKRYVIVTVATVDTRDEAVVSDGERLLHYFHTDHVSVFYWR